MRSHSHFCCYNLCCKSSAIWGPFWISSSWSQTIWGESLLSLKRDNKRNWASWLSIKSRKYLPLAACTNPAELWCFGSPFLWYLRATDTILKHCWIQWGNYIKTYAEATERSHTLFSSLILYVRIQNSQSWKYCDYFTDLSSQYAKYLPNINQARTNHGGCNLPVSIFSAHYSSYRINIRAESCRQCSEYLKAVIESGDKRKATLFSHPASRRVLL